MYNTYMANIILDSRKLMAYEDLKYLCEFTGKPQELADSIWQGLLQYPELYDEFLYYLDNRALKDKFTFKGYSLTDIYVYRLTEHNLFSDTGKNTAACSKDAMILETFEGMLALIASPDEYIKKINSGNGMDKF